MTDIPERGPLAAFDRRQIGQALTNLLRNATDAVAMAPPGTHAGAGRIEVSGAHRGRGGRYFCG